MSNIPLGTSSEDLPTRSSPVVTASDTNTAGLLFYSERGYDAVVAVENGSTIQEIYGNYKSAYNGHYLINAFFNNLQGTPGTLYCKRMVASDAVSSTVSLMDTTPVTPVAAWKFNAGYLGNEDKGAWGNQLWVLPIASSRDSSQLSVNAALAATTITPISVAPFDIGDWILIADGVNSEYAKITAIDENLGTLTIAAGLAHAFAAATPTNISVYDITLKVYKKDSVTGNVDLIETWSNLSPEPAHPRYFIKIVNDSYIGSKFIYGTDLKTSIAAQTDFPAVYADAFTNAVHLTTGADGTALNTVQMAAQLTSFDNYPIRYLSNAESFSETVWEDGEQYCNVRGDTEWVGCPDWSSAQTYDALRVWGNKRRKSRKVYAFNNGMWYYVDDPISKDPNPVKRVPNVGHMLGYTIWIKNVRGVHKVPAGRRQTPVGIRSLANEILDKTQLTNLADIGVNMQTTVGTEFPVRSAVTPSKLPEYKFENALSMTIYFKTSYEQSFEIEENEPNTAALFNRIRLGMTSFALDFYRSSSNGGSEGGFADGSFSDVVIIQVDDKNNPLQKVLAGEVRAYMWFRAPAPAYKIRIGVGLLYT